MKKTNLWKCVCLFLLICTSMPGQAQDWKNLLGNLKDGVSKVVNKVTVNDKSIIGTWRYVQPACVLCSKLKISSENTSYEFKEDGTYMQTIAGKSSTGTYTFDKDNLTVVMTGKLGFSTTAYVSFSGDQMTLAYDADRVWDIAKGIASVASKFMDNNLLTIFNSVSDNYEGMQLGFKLQK